MSEAVEQTVVEAPVDEQPEADQDLAPEETLDQAPRAEAAKPKASTKKKPVAKPRGSREQKPAAKKKPAKKPDGEEQDPEELDEESEPVLAIDLVNWLDETGASQTRVTALRDWIDGQQQERDEPVTGDEAMEWMKTEPAIFQQGTLERAGKYVYGGWWHLQLPGESSQQTIERLNTVSTNQKKELEGSRAMCSRLQLDNNDLRKQVARLEEDVRLLKMRLGES